MRYDKRAVHTWTSVAAAVLILAASPAWAGGSGSKPAPGRQRKTLGGFSLEHSRIPVKEIMSGGPRKDGIPALTGPRVLTARQARYLRPADTVIGVKFGTQARAYPLRILVWHECVNDIVGGRPIAVTYCPLCYSSLVFDRDIGGEVREFGVSGLLWNSNVLLYDRRRNTREESLWSQVHMRAVTGPAAGKGLKLKLLAAFHGSWGEWKKRHPDTTVLSIITGYRRPYKQEAYARYFSNDRLAFPVKTRKSKPARFANKERMIIVQVNDRLKAYAFRDLARAANEKGLVEDTVAGKRIRLTYSGKSRTATAAYADPENKDEAPAAAYGFWFAVSAMMDKADVYTPPALRPPRRAAEPPGSAGKRKGEGPAPTGP